MSNKANRYEQPQCSAVEFEVGGVILSASNLSQENFTLDNYDKLTDVKW
jgi:hypothetical protein